MPQVAIIDYGVGNLRSVEKAFGVTGCAAVVSSDERVLYGADRLVLPGVGAFAACMNALTERGFDELVRERVAESIPLLGVCVGMQMLFEESEEFGTTRGLGLLPGRVRRFSEDLVVPHVGWNRIRQRVAHPLFEGIEDAAFFYFVHSYAAPLDSGVTIGEADHGVGFAAAVAKASLFATQFHPEKSGDAGLALYESFVKEVGA